MKWLWLPVVLLLGFCALVVRRVTRQLGIIRAQLAAYRRGDYEAQLKIVEGLRVRGSEPPDYLFFHGSACFQLGRLEEAEQAIRRSLAKETNARLKTICRDELGRILMAQGRWEEAAGCLRKCIAEAPRRGSGYRAMAEMLLRREGERAPALEAAQSAVAADRTARKGIGKLGKEEHEINLGESLAFLAWALAENQGAGGEIERALAEAFALCGDNVKPILAELHYCAGNARAALGETAASARHFQSAAEIDGAGYYGRLSRQAWVAGCPPG